MLKSWPLKSKLSSCQSGNYEGAPEIEDKEGIIQNLGPAEKVRVYCCNLNFDKYSILQYSSKLANFVLNSLDANFFLIHDFDIEAKHEFLVVKFANGYGRFDWGSKGLYIRVSKIKKKLFNEDEIYRPKWNIIRNWSCKILFNLSLNDIKERMKMLLVDNQEKYNLMSFNCKNFARNIFYQCRKENKND